MAKRTPAKDAPAVNREEQERQLYADLDRATELAFDAKKVVADNTGDVTEYDSPDLQNLAKLLEVKAKILGLIGADSKARGGAEGAVSVPIEKAKELIAAAELRMKEQKE